MASEMRSFNDHLFDEFVLEELERRLEMAQFPLMPAGEPPVVHADHQGPPVSFPGQHCGMHGGVHDCQAHNSCLAHGGHNCVAHGGHTCVEHGAHCFGHGWHCVTHGGHTCVEHGSHTCVAHNRHCDVHAISCVEHGMSCVGHGSLLNPGLATAPHPHSDAH